jgi:hypothetical protein
MHKLLLFLLAHQSYRCGEDPRNPGPPQIAQLTQERAGLIATDSDRTKAADHQR